MSSILSTTQRTTLVVSLLAAGQGAAVAGLGFGWAPAWALGLCLSFSGLAAVVLATGGGAMRSFLADFKAHTQRIAEGNLTVDIDVRGSGDAAAAMQSLQALQGSLRQTLGAIRSGADGVSLAAQEIAQGNTDLSTRTEQTASNLQQAASSAWNSLTGHRAPQTADSAPPPPTSWPARPASVAARGGSVVSRSRGLDHGRDQRTAARRSPTSSAPSTASPSRPTSWR